jgi:hypothetical protein
MDTSDDHYCSGEAIRVGDQVRSGNWTGVVVFVLSTQSFADGYIPDEWSYLGRGFMVEFDQVGLVFAEEADGHLILVGRAEVK